MFLRKKDDFVSEMPVDKWHAYSSPIASVADDIFKVEVSSFFTLMILSVHNLPDMTASVCSDS